jgi:hypothetical protein
VSTGVAQVGTPSGNKAVEFIRLCAAHIYNGDDQWACGYVETRNALCERCGENLGPHVFEAGANDPRLGGWGRVEARACVALDLIPRFIWDVNRYYRRLCVHPRASKRLIREAYQALRGQESPELTGIVKFLLNDEDRWRYDNLPIGRINIDEEIMHTIRVAESRAASDKIARGEGDLAQFQHLYVGLDEPSESVVDGGSWEDEDDVPTRPYGTWNWGHYIWRSGCQDFPRLAEWQGALAAAIAEREGGIDFAVGFLGHSNVAWDVTVVGYRIVAFLNDRQQPTEQLAQQAASRVVQLSKEQTHGIPQGR